ncbi:MAG: hypothetical protein AAB385_07640, partial [Planctomycetota bacterium]
MTDVLVAAGVAFVIGAGVGGLVFWLLRRQAQQAKAAEMSALVQELRTAFSALSREALSANADDFLKLAKSRLDQQT